MSTRQYERYTPGGTAWLPAVPSHWGILPARRLFRQRRDPALVEDEQLSATQRYGVVPQRLFMEQADQNVVLALSGTENFKHVEPDDFVISLRSFQGGIERSRYAGCVSPAYTVLRPAVQIDADYFEQLLKCSALVSALQTTTDGIRDGKTISYGQFGGLALPVPPLEEQETIATFLASESAKIDVLIAEQVKLIALLAEKRQATISRATTRGLDPDVPTKDSGVPWLGEVPEHWAVVPAKRVADVFVPQRNKPELNDLGDGVCWATMEDVKQARLRSTGLWVSDDAIANAGSRILAPGAVIASCVGTFGVATINDVEVVVNQQLQAYLPSRLVKAEYLRYVVLASRQYFERIGTAATLVYVNQYGFENLPVPLPTVREQEEIASALDGQLAVLDEVGHVVEHGIALLRERRSALITAAVTGQIDVRGIAQCEYALSEGLAA